MIAVQPMGSAMSVDEREIAAVEGGGSGSDPSTSEIRPHPRSITWVGASSLALGGSNQSIFLIGALLASQGSAAIPLLALGLVLSYMATPGWIELSCMFPNRVGGIAACCAEAFRPYSNVLSNLTGVCYWWGWVPTCGLTAIFSADAIHQWYLPGVPIKVLATVLVLAFMVVNLCGLRWAARVAIPIAFIGGLLAFCTSFLPVLAGHVDWHQAASYHLKAPFSGAFGHLTSAMAGLYLIGFAAPAFEAAACHMGEMKLPARDQPRAMWVSGAVASIYFVIMPIVWLGVFGTTALQGDLASLLGPTFAPLFGSFAKAAAIWFIAFNMFSGTIQPLSGASRTLSQLSEDGLLPRSIGFRSIRTDAPVVAILITATASIVFLLAGDPTSLVAAANLTYLIGIALPSVAVWILRRHEPDRPRLYTARRTSILLGIAAALVWLLSTILGFEQFGLPVVIFGLALAFSGSIAYFWRMHQDRKLTGEKGPQRSLHLKLTGAMLAVLILDGTGYLIAVNNVGPTDPSLVAVLKDIFVTVGLLTITVGLVLPGMISHTAEQVAKAAKGLADGTLLELTEAMEALSSGDLESAHASVSTTRVDVRTRDEFGEMAASFNLMQDETARVAVALDGAAQELKEYRDNVEQLVRDRTAELSAAGEELREAQERRRLLVDRVRALSSRIGSQSGERPDVWSTMTESAEALGTILGADAVTVHLVDSDGRLGDVRASWERAGIAETSYFMSVPQDIRDLLFSAVMDREVVVLSDVQALLRTFVPEAAREYVQDSRLGALVVCPFSTSDSEILGVVLVGSVGSAHRWTTEDTALIETISADLGRAVVNAELFERQQLLVHQLQELDQAKTEMISTFSHELRTPLASIRAYVEMLQDGDAEILGGEAHVLEVIQRNTARLSSLIEDILTLSHLDAEVFDIPLRPVFFNPLIDSVCTALQPAIQEKELELSIEKSGSGALVLGDPEQLERVLFNLVSNAIKFTPRGGQIKIETSEGPSAVTATVTDTGIGIPAEEQAQIFTRFFRGSNAVDQAVPGTGLGLAISQAIIEHHQGTLAFSSDLGSGTTFRLTIPTPKAVQNVRVVHPASATEKGDDAS